jgi:hypothetical protein
MFLMQTLKLTPLAGLFTKQKFDEWIVIGDGYIKLDDEYINVHRTHS